MCKQEKMKASDFADLYDRFRAPVTELDCGRKCAPYNEAGVPFCCDPKHAVPSAYLQEWDYLKANTDLWQPWQGTDQAETGELEKATPPGHKLIACLGHQHCQRSFRSVTCRAFPFFPYITSTGEFIGLSVYWEYENRCWVISNLNAVKPEYRQEFIAAYDWIFMKAPEEKQNFWEHSDHMRKVFSRRRRTIPLLHRDGCFYKISPKTEKINKARPEAFPKYGPYKIAALLPFPDEGPALSP
jgi:hypothetical protein